MESLASRLLRPRSLAYAVLALAFLVATVVLPASGAFDQPPLPADLGETTEATVRDLRVTQTLDSPRGEVRVEEVLLTLADGVLVTVERTVREGDPVFTLARGDRVLVTESQGPEGPRYSVVDRARRVPLTVLAVAFAALVLAVSGWHGLRSLVGLLASLLVILRFLIPAILSGADPIIVTVAGALLVMATTLFVAHGVNRRSFVALGGTAGALIATALLAAASIRFAELTGIATDDAATLQALLPGQIDARGLLLSGVIIGALGVLDDVTMTQSSAVFELRAANPRLGPDELMRRGMNVGRDHIAATLNTLVLAYAGGALPLLVILSAGPEQLGTLISRDLLATEIVRTIVGSAGLVLAVPITTALAAAAAARVAPLAPASSGDSPSGAP